VQHTDDSGDQSDEDTSKALNSELYDMYEVFAAERKRRETRASKLPEAMLKPPVVPSTSCRPAQASAPPPIPPFTLATNTPCAPQFKYQANIEDQKLTDELAAWLLEGKLAHTTPAHILAASHPIQKTLAERLQP